MAPIVVKIESGSSQGTGFLLSTPKKSMYYAIATARHVIEHATKWEEPILIHFSQEDKPYLYNEDDRIILFSPREQDYAVLLIGKRSLKLLCSPCRPASIRHLLGAREEVG